MAVHMAERGWRTLRRWVRRLANRLQDLRLGISTTGIAPAEAPDHVHYATVSYSCTHSVLRKLGLAEEDTFVDVGCGKGRVVCLAARSKQLRRIVGVEYSPALATAAERNVRRLKGRKSTVEIICQPAERLDYSSATVLYFFNPFEPLLLDTILRKIRTDRRGSATRMVFVMESDGHREVFSRHGWLTCYERFEDEEGHPVALYRTAQVA